MGFSIGEEGDGVVNLVQLFYYTDQGQAVASHQVRTHGEGIRDHQIKI